MTGARENRQRPHLAILRNEVAADHANWLLACAERAYRITHAVIDLSKEGWREAVLNGGFDGLLAQPSGWSAAARDRYAERIAELAQATDLPMIPSAAEIAIYENKRVLASWLAENRIPHPDTRVFDNAEEAVAFVRSAVYPLVAKTSIGAGGRGVRVLQNAEEALGYVDSTFNGQGAPRSTSPKWRGGALLARGLRKLTDPAALIERARNYGTLRADVQRDHVLFQAFVPHSFEWRAVRIGDSFFAHKKLAHDGKASGSLLKGYGDPPKPLLDLVRDITDAHGFRSVAIDLFEDTAGGYLVNEIQCVFGQSDPHQMLVDNVPGRYLWTGTSWEFQAGDFNRFECYLLRLDDLLTRIAER